MDVVRGLAVNLDVNEDLATISFDTVDLAVDQMATCHLYECLCLMDYMTHYTPKGSYDEKFRAS